ncbi:carbamoyltransferase family protein [Glaciecola petra]|uniref:Carbamoyltransferase C-terminal domain-containing protein n=1 Tax=Glaciecola petra TaxID=3075602 RepID=A0ABU2ZMI4_9ALTE|nr:carbamoyltransferase C-terminal domain-containing protein [Aestuariibacter sp. P117]MDT0593615.1 carbamoyltransferase C-terminal domain-containing protein [Aestuariibacter sp. P117]
MIVLGISPLDKDATVSIVKDGVVLFAAGEERFTRQKQQDGFPYKAVEKALEYTGIKLEEIDKVAYAFLDADKETEIFTKNVQDEKTFIEYFDEPDVSALIKEAKQKVPVRDKPIHGLQNPNEKMDKSMLHNAYYAMSGKMNFFSKKAAIEGTSKWAEDAKEGHKRWQKELLKGLSKLGLSDKLSRIDHHLSHAANAYLCSGFDKALCITLDGYGTGLAGSASIAENGRIKRLQGVQYPHSLGTMYEHVTSSLGFKPSRHEGKIVGLASYGDPDILTPILLSRIEQRKGDFKIYQANNVFLSRLLASEFPKIDVAAAYQKVLEVVAAEFVKYWVEQTGMTNIVLSGGVTANVKLNQRIFEVDGVNEIFVYPNMGDGGCGTGAALYLSNKAEVKESISNVYLGPDFSDDEIQVELEKAGLTFTKPENYAAEVAKVIHEGNVVARFDGRMEYGPRALGNRSIMYHAREPEVNQWLNKRLGRTEFMPFAPVTLYEKREDCYINIKGAEHAAEFMTVTFDCTEQMKNDCPAAVHVDGTARPQLVRREVNQGYYDILNEYYKLSGIPSLINTSFNMHEEPIVCSPHDAVRAFLDGNLDYLAIGGFLVKHPEQASFN